MNDWKDAAVELPTVTYINVKGRVEHEAMLNDEDKMISLGLDPYYERMVYLKRWDGYLGDSK